MSDVPDANGDGGDTSGAVEGHGQGQDREPSRSGRTLVTVVFVGAVLLAGGFGFLLGSIGPRALGSIGILGVTLFRPTPGGMALYGMTITGLVLGTIYVGARFAVDREERSSSGR